MDIPTVSEVREELEAALQTFTADMADIIGFGKDDEGEIYAEAYSEDGQTIIATYSIAVTITQNPEGATS